MWMIWVSRLLEWNIKISENIHSCLLIFSARKRGNTDNYFFLIYKRRVRLSWASWAMKNVLHISVKFHLSLNYQIFFQNSTKSAFNNLIIPQCQDGSPALTCRSYPCIIRQVDSFHVPMLFLDMLEITWIPCDLFPNSRHIKCPVKYVHTYDQTRSFFLSIFLKGYQPTENWQVAFMAVKAVLRYLDFWLLLPFSMFSVATCLYSSKSMYVFASMAC